MLFQDQGNFSVGLARSEDGINWTHIGDSPTVTRSDLPTGDELYQSELIDFNGIYLWLQEIGPGSRATAIYLISLLVDQLP